MIKREEKFQFFKKGEKEGWAVGQFNVSTLEALKAVFQAAKNLKSPVIIGTSEGESKYLGLKEAAVLVRALESHYGVPALLNLDHAKSFDYIKEAIEAGYDTVHFDGSRLPLEENISQSKAIVKAAHKRKILVEGEVGAIFGASKILENSPEIKEEDLTKAADAERFTKETGVDNLAVSVGTFHGMTESGNPHIDIARLKEIKAALAGRAGLVLHGGSGTPKDDVKEAIKSGIVKINVNTELRAAYAKALSRFFEGGIKETTPYKFLPQVVDDVQKVVEKKIILFGSEGKFN